MMKKLQFRRAIFLFVAVLTGALSANAQDVVGHTGLKIDPANYYDADGKFIYTDNDSWGDQRRVNAVDTLTAEQLSGHHWAGNEISGGQDMEGVYLVNAKTGEYLVLGDNWGTTPMSDYAGTLFDLRGGKTCRADKNDDRVKRFQVADNDPKLGDRTNRAGKGYLICFSTNNERCIGRNQTSSGYRGSFEENPHMVGRSSQRHEYTLHPDDGFSGAPFNNDDGHMIFYFHPVTGADGKQYYVIYTHRQTTGPVHDEFYDNLNDEDPLYERWQKTIEFGNRDSYLCMKSQKSNKADYNIIAYKKFAGKMSYTRIEPNGPAYFQDGYVIDEETGEIVLDEEGNPVVNWVYNEDYVMQVDENFYYEKYTGLSNANGLRAPNDTTTSFKPSLMFAFPWGDERSYDEQGKQAVTLAEGLLEVAADSTCLWKIVTREERLKYNTMASVDHPVDMSILIENHKFFPTYQPYDIDGLNQTTSPNFGWKWYDRETGEAHHEHSYKTSAIETEFHKIGTNYYDRWGWGESIPANPNSTQKAHWRAKTNERQMTQGEEANYVGSIYNGTAALRQTITGLRAGNYIVYCRAFYSPYAMSRFDNSNGWGEYSGDYDEEYNYVYDTFTNDGDPRFDGDPIDLTVQAVINLKEVSDSSFFFAIGKDGVERKRDVPNIFSGMMPLDFSHLDGVSKQTFATIDNQQFTYTPLGEALAANGAYVEDEEGNIVFIANATSMNNLIGHTYSEELKLLQDSTVFAKVSSGGQNYFVPRNLTGAARFFSAVDRTKHENAFNYRIGLPVEVGDDGELTIGIDHKEIRGHEDWVCFDNFELVYYGPKQSWEFVIDEDEPDNCTRYHDLFDWESNGVYATERMCKVAIKRSLGNSKFTPITLPVSLTRKQVRQAFGEDVKISEPSNISYRTIHFSAVSTDVSGTGAAKTERENTVAIEAYKPYIIQPSIPAPVSVNQTWTRTRFLGDNPLDWPAAQWSEASVAEKNEIYIPKRGRNNQMREGGNSRWKLIPGPIYLVDSVLITKAAHYQPSTARHINQSLAPADSSAYYSAWYRASKQWNPVGSGYVGDKRMKIKGSQDGKVYQLRYTCYYDPSDLPEQVDGRTIQIPPYSYYFDANGDMKFNAARGSLQRRSFSFYLQIVESDKIDTAAIANQYAANVGPHCTYGASVTSNVISNADSGMEGVVVRTKNASNNDYNGLLKVYDNVLDRSYLSMAPAGANGTPKLIVTAPDGYNIAGYKIGGYCTDNTKETYRLTAPGGSSIDITENATAAAPACLQQSGLDNHSMTFTLNAYTTGSVQRVRFPVFIVCLRQASEGGSAKVFAGNVGDFEWVPADDEIDGIAETFREYENPANDRYYDLQGRPVKTPRKNGIYIYRGKKIVY